MADISKRHYWNINFTLYWELVIGYFWQYDDPLHFKHSKKHCHFDSTYKIKSDPDQSQEGLYCSTSFE